MRFWLRFIIKKFQNKLIAITSEIRKKRRNSSIAIADVDEEVDNSDTVIDKTDTEENANNLGTSIDITDINEGAND